MEIKIDHQTCYNLIVGYYVLGNTEKMRNCFTKMLLVRHYDSDSDDDNEGEISILQVRCFPYSLALKSLDQSNLKPNLTFT